jgi:ABC-2 type transport system permease protein
VTVVPVLVGFALGLGFSLDPSVIRDTARVMAASLAYCAIVVVSAGLLMLAFSSLSRNSRYVGAMWLGFWSISWVTGSVLEQTVGAEWCPLVSYTSNLNRIRDALLDSGTAWDRILSLGEVGRREVRGPMGMGPFGPGRRSPTGAEGDRSGPRFAEPRPERRSRSSWAPPTYPWQWSAGVLAGLAAASLLVLATRVRGLDRLR